MLTGYSLLSLVNIYIGYSLLSLVNIYICIIHNVFDTVFSCLRVIQVLTAWL